ncbi:hypothetical protein MMC18_005479 [Xylographa bjoerkii]|nr:hypothetical protein [Xylographa bjoerkii]
MKFQINESTRHEEVFQVNYLSTALLSILLLPILKKKRPTGKPGRLTIVSPGLALTATFANQKAECLISSFEDPAKWTMSVASDRHSTSKLLGQMFVVNQKGLVAPDDVASTSSNRVRSGHDAQPERSWLREVYPRRMELSLRRTVDVAAWTGSKGD